MDGHLDPQKLPHLMERRKFLSLSMLAAGSAAGAALLASCAPGATPTPTTSGAASTPRRGGTLTVADLGSSNDTLDPKNFGLINSRVTQLYEPLIGYGPSEVANLEMILAESFEMDSATQYTIRLKEGITFHNGKTLTSADIAASIRRSAGTGATYEAIFPTLIDLDALEQLDDRTLRVTLLRPHTMLRDLFPQVFIVPEDFDPTKAVGTGPYKLGSFTPGARSTLDRYDGYWREGMPYFDSIVTLSLSDPAAQANALLSGQADVNLIMAYNKVAAVESAQGLSVDVFKYSSFQNININTTIAPFDDPLVRQAMKHLINREQIVQQVYGGYGWVGNDVPAPLDPNFDTSLKAPEYDPDKAKSLLKQAGVEGFSSTVFTAATAAGIVELAEAFAQQARDAGIKIESEQLDEQTYFGPEYRHRPMSTSFWPGANLTNMFETCFTTGAPFNSTNFSDSEFDGLWSQACQQTDDAKRKELLFAMQAILNERGTFLIPAFLQGVNGYKDTVKGMQPYPNAVAMAMDYATIWRA
ncbi:ABC transporter substrate-binding protein [Microbacterium sp.]|uniref:ABC transporter substrate-binding protein n=1 Tax=Microbacterium sp. TaxID=51671 RepID=UPI0039E40AAF